MFQFKRALLPVTPGSGFSMKGFYIWCSSVIKGENGRFYMFAARWPEESGFPDGYMTHSEIVRASTDALGRPFRFEAAVIGKRSGGYWDSMMAHNPFIIKLNGTYVMFYIGTPDGQYTTRAIGYATADRLDGAWTRSDRPLDLPPNANNPALLAEPDGRILLYFRDGDLKVSVAEARQYSGPYRILKRDILPHAPVEDMFVFKKNGMYVMLAEDTAGGYTGVTKAGACFLSTDGIHWQPDSPALAYGFDIPFSDGSALTLQRRERPAVFEDGGSAWLFTGAKTGGADRLTGGKTWNMVQQLQPFWCV